MKKRIYNTVRKALESEELHYLTHDDEFFFSMKCDHSTYDVHLICREEMEYLVVLVTCSLHVPEDRIERMCRWIVEKNYNLILGDFKLDVSDGELSFRHTTLLDEGAVNQEIVKVAYESAISIFDKSYEDIVKSMYLEKESAQDWALKHAMKIAKQMEESEDGGEVECGKRRFN